MENKDRTQLIPVKVSAVEKLTIQARAKLAGFDTTSDYARFVMLGGSFLPAPDGAQLVPVVTK